ncbi:MAG TPA: hypothetical protein VM802_18625 [Chitinophaga sp.]|uniref:hypothetical protein n=1 Tax=Chitinophaga sp. TaxID=1869181 RepID=UPI002C6813CA|nr:hypothetical protein [Chitinophaga sp.]HVI46901.1 hypothetical protein [Chitinophaga sp.]
MKCKLYLGLLLLLTSCLVVTAQEKTDSTGNENTKSAISITFGKYPKHRDKIYVTSGLSGMLSFASMKQDGEYMRNIPRFSFIFNFNTNFNKDFTKNFGVFTGIDFKNIGLISKPNDSLKLKQRVYTFGIPVGFKIGDVTGGTFFFFAGGEIDLAFNYKEKQFINGKKVHKFNEWFSDRTPLFMPSLFAGFRIEPGFGLKVQYYPQNFFNRDFSYTSSTGKVYPYKGTDANLIFVTLGYNFSGVNYFKVKKKRHYMRMKSGKAEIEVNY